ncbi:MAG: universal stress protein [Acidimicrobiales bacterium]
MALNGPVLVGLDGSAEAGLACSWAASVAVALDCPLIVAHTYSLDDYVGGPDTAAVGAIAKLDGWLAGLDLGGLTVDRVEQTVQTGPAGPGLVRLAGSEDAVLVVLGGHGRLMASSALGRVAQHVTFRSRCPVAVVHGLGGAVSSAPLLVGFDAADANSKVTAWAERFATRLGVRLEAVTAERPRGDLMPADQLVASLAGQFGSAVTFTRVVGDPGPELISRAAEIDASAIIIGQRQDRNLGGRLLGHTASWMLRKSARPVIVLNHD